MRHLGDRDVTTADEELERVKRRLEREYKARRQAEVIAERGMRELWEANSELRNQVTMRTAELDRLLDALQHRARAAAGLTAGAAALLHDQVESGDGRRLLGLITAIASVDANVGGASAERIRCDPSGFGDQVLARWQRRAAKHGQLLTVEATAQGTAPEVDWSLVQAAADLLLEHCVGHGGPGAVRLSIDAAADGVSLVMTGGEGLLVVGHGAIGAAPLTLAEAAPQAAELLLVDRLATQAGGSFQVDHAEGRAIISVLVPAVAR